MKKLTLCTALALAMVVGLTVSANACDNHPTAQATVAGAKCPHDGAKTAATGGCGSKTAQVAGSKEGCGGHAATAGAKEGGCSKAAHTASAGGCVDSAMARVMETLPKMTYKVGDLETPCCHTAKKASQESQTPVVYLVGGESYTCRETAMNKLAELITAELPKVTQVTHVVDGEAMQCPNAAAKAAADKHTKAKVMLAGVEFDCAEKAQTVAAKLAARLEQSHGCSIAFAAGCDKTQCDKAAKTAGAEAGCDKSKCDKAKTAGAEAGCDKSKCDKAKTAGAEAGCDKSKCDKAKTAGAEGGCDKAKTAAADGKSGCCADKAKTAGAEGGCDKAKAVATGGAGCGGGDKAAQTASAEGKSGCCADKAKTAQTASAESTEGELTPALANAQALVKEIVEFVSTAQAS